MKSLARVTLVVGILNLLAAVAFLVCGAYAVGFAWLGAYDLYVDLDKKAVIDHAKLAEVAPELVEGYALGDRLVSAPASAGYGVVSFATIALAINGIALCSAVALTRGSRRKTEGERA